MNEHKDTPTSRFYVLILKSESSHRAPSPIRGSHKHFGIYYKLCWDGYAQSVLNKHDPKDTACISTGTTNMESFWFNVTLPLLAEKLLSQYLYVSWYLNKTFKAINVQYSK